MSRVYSNNRFVLTEMMAASDGDGLTRLQFKCCGYLDLSTPPYVQDTTCTNDAVAMMLGGCAAPFSAFANKLLDIVFTTMFGIVGKSWISPHTMEHDR
jgi:hypothetical protein